MLFTRRYGTIRLYVNCSADALLDRFYYASRWTRCSLRKWLILVCILLLASVFLFPLFQDEETKRRHMAIVSATYFRSDDPGVQIFRLVQSPFEPRVNGQYGKIVLLFVADSKFRRRYSRIWCTSINDTSELHSTALPTYTTPPLPFCKWTLYIGVCNVVDGMQQLMIASEKDSQTRVLVPHREPVREQYDVVGCFSPLFLNEHWQLLLTGLEVRRAHGLSLQVLYVHSMRAQLMRILRVYESKGIIAVEKWSDIDIGNESGLEYDPNYELVWRNQEGAHTDCFLKYKLMKPDMTAQNGVFDAFSHPRARSAAQCERCALSLIDLDHQDRSDLHLYNQAFMEDKEPVCGAPTADRRHFLVPQRTCRHSLLSLGSVVVSYVNRGRSWNISPVDTRVSTKYIIVGDLDDILLPRIAPTYVQEFQFLLKKRNPIAIFYARQDADVFTSSNPRNFSIYSLLQDAILTNASATGKQVAITENVITVNLHWPGLSNLNGRLNIDFNVNFIYHLRNWFYDVQPRQYMDPDVRTSTAMTGDLLPLRSVLSGAQLLKYQHNFEVLMNESFRDTFDSLYTEQLYYPLVDECYNQIFYKQFRSHRAIHSCPGPIRCHIPRMPGVRCVISRTHYAHFNMTHYLQAHFPVRAEFVESNNGCKM